MVNEQDSERVVFDFGLRPPIPTSALHRPKSVAAFEIDLVEDFAPDSLVLAGWDTAPFQMANGGKALFEVGQNRYSIAKLADQTTVD